MNFVIYNLKTFALLSSREAQRSSYETIGAAKAAITRVAKSSEMGRQRTASLKNFKAEEWAIVDRDEFYASICPKPKMITVINLMSGKPIQIPEGAPRCCDPSSELYWAM